MRTNSKKLLGALAVAGVVAATGTAFTNSNTVPGGDLGQGVGELAGYVTSAVAYTYDADGTTITDVSFTLDKEADTVQGRVLSGDGTPEYVVCDADTDTDDTGPDVATPRTWDCDVTDVAVADATGLDVFAATV